jgi:hypothetical protein
MAKKSPATGRVEVGVGARVWDGEVREEGRVAVAGERDCVLEGCLGAKGA